MRENVFQPDLEAMKEVNRSGFPLQIAISNLVTNNALRKAWHVTHLEQAWKNESTGSKGFADLILTDSYRTTILNVECKRVLNTEWLFLLPDDSPQERLYFKAWVTFVKEAKTAYFGWFDLIAEPGAYESLFCVVKGQDPKVRPMLERTAAEVVESTEAIATAELPSATSENEAVRVYFNIIVTTAALKVCKFSPNSVSVESGDVSCLEAKEVGFVRFRKQLTTHNISNDATPMRLSHQGINDSTVFVVNSEHFLSFLEEFEWGGTEIQRLLRL